MMNLPKFLDLLGKFVHISSHDKELKDLTAKLASTPYDVLDDEQYFWN